MSSLGPHVQDRNYNPGKRERTGAGAGVSVEEIPPVLTEAQRNRILRDWNDTAAYFPDLCAHELFEGQVARDPSAVAVVCGARTLTYGELNKRANQVARYLRKRGIGPDVLVGVCLRRTPEMVIALLAVWKAGGAYVPLDSAYPEERLSFMVADSGVRVLLTEEGCRHLFPAMQEKTVCLDSEWKLMESEEGTDLKSGAAPSNLAYVMYTSGSTGKPKGAMILHRGLVNYLWWAIKTYNVQPGGSVPVHSSISFDLTVTSLYPALMIGGQVELLAEDVGAQNLLAALRRGKNRDLVKITPAHLEALTLQLSAGELAEMTRGFVIGGENLLAESLSVWRKSAPSTRLINEYGPTETVVGCCVYEVKPDDAETGSVPIGRPIANTQLYILDEKLEPVPPGIMGELYIGGAGVARGYLNRPDLTQERFLRDPFSAAGDSRMYKTGDLARYREDGIIEYLGRVDNQVKIRGYRIELGEIEAALASHPEVQSCVVLAREDTPGQKQLVGYVVPRDSREPSAESLAVHLKDRLPEYMVPAKFVSLPWLPLTQNGKVDRKALPAPVHSEPRAISNSVTARNSIEEALVAIWMDLFKIESVGIHDDFFDLGGHSLLAIKVMSRVRDELGVDLPVLNLFENPTIASLAENLAQAGAATSAAQSNGHLQPAPVQPAPKPRVSEERRGMTPFYFGPDEAPLFGVYQPPAGSADRQCAVLFCPPIGLAYMRTHYAFRIIASQLARAGFHTLRFDYHGTGDSSGEIGTGQFETWINDAVLATRELLKRSGVRNLVVVGLRLGAAIGIEALIRQNLKAAGLVLWDPAVTGSEFLSELESLHAELVAERKAPLRPSDELLGVRFPADLRGAIRELDVPGRLQKLDVERIALIVSENEPLYNEMLSSMRSRWPEALFRPFGDPMKWDSLKALFEGRLSGPIVGAVAEITESLV